MSRRFNLAQGRPGDRLRAFAKRLCSADTVERVLDPLIADLRFEHATAMCDGRRWRARVVRLAGYWAFLKALTVHGASVPVRAIHDWASADGHAIARTLTFSAGIIGAIALLLAALPFSQLQSRVPAAHAGTLFMYVIPQAIPLAIAFGLPLGIVTALRGRGVTRRTSWSILTIAAVCAIASFLVCAWIIPAANQAFRLLVSGRSFLFKGPNELALREVSARLNMLREAGPSAEVFALTFSYHARLAASFAPCVMALFAMCLVRLTRMTLLSGIVIVLSSAVYIGYGAVVVIGPSLSGGWPPLWTFIWFPNMFFAAVSGILFICSGHTGSRTGCGAAL